MLSVYFIYYNVVLSFDGLLRFAASATLELLAAYYLVFVSKKITYKHEDISIAETYLMSVFVNVFGGILYWNYYPHKYYDNMCITIMVIQITILSWRVFKDGKLIGRCCVLFPLFGSAVSSINKNYSFLQTKKIKIKEAKNTP